MLQKDYLMKMTQMLAAVLVKVLTKKEQKDYAEAEVEIESAAKTMVGLDLKLIKILDINDILKLIKTSDIFAGRCLVSAELLKEYADILVEKGKHEDSLNIYVKSLHLYLETVLTKELPQPEEYYERIDFLIKTLSSLDFSKELRIKIFEYYEFSGQYSKAEDILFEMLDSGFEEIKDKGIKYYNRLQLKSEEELVKGNFSKDEIEESLAELNSRFQN